MRNIVQTESIYKTSNAVTIHKISDNSYAVWNRYIPSILFLNNDGIKFLEFMRRNKLPYKKLKGVKRTLRKLIVNNLMYYGDNDSYKSNFLKKGEENLRQLFYSMENQYKNKLPYEGFAIINTACNLKCSYCILNYVKAKNHNPRKSINIAKLLSCIDTFLIPKQDTKKIIGRRINFNGGEILLNWYVVKAVVDHVNNNYPNEKIEYDINTNATLITEEIAEFLASNFKNIGISIDGYKNTHNKTRQYHNGKGSFEDVISGIKILNKYLSKPITSIQGTLVKEQELEIKKLQSMKEYGFQSVRLGINLLNTNENIAEEMSDLHFRMANSSIENGWSTMDNYFDTYKVVLNKKREGFNFYCRGFNDLAGKYLYYNIETETVNHLCSFSTDVQVELNQIDNNIYHPLIFEKSYKYLEERFKTFNTYCQNCEIAGICRGGCVLTGIDSYNKINNSACVFQKRTWTHFLEYV